MSASSAPASPGSQPMDSDGGQAVWFGHPKGLFTLFFAELWERFCFYGMRALLAVYVAEQFTNGDQGEASKMYGAFTALVYALGVFGGSVADKILGYRRAIILGGVLMAAGEFMLMIPNETMFLMGLSTLVVGVGLFKPNISTLVGKLYKPGDARRDGGFTIFYMGINLGAFLAPIVCRYVAGVMGEGGKPDYRYGFMVAGLGMLLGVITFYRGYAHLGDKGLPPKGREGSINIIQVALGSIIVAPGVYFLLSEKEYAGYSLIALLVGILGYLFYVAAKTDKTALQRMIALFVLLLGNIVFWASFEQAGNSLNFFARDQVKLTSDETFPLGGTRGELVALSSTTATFDSPIVRTEKVPVSVSYPSPSDPTKRLTASGEIAAGTYAARTPINIRFQNDKGADMTAEVAGAVGTAVAARGAAGAVPKGVDGAVGDVRAKADKDAREKAVMFTAGPVREFEWFQSVNAIFIVLLGPLFAILWVWLDRRGANPSIPFKFGLGLVQAGLGYVLLLASFKGADAGGLVPWYMLTGLYFVHTTAELCISPVGLSMVTKLAPASMTGLVMGAWFLSIANANYAAGLFSALVSSAEVDESIAGGVDALNRYSAVFTPIVWMSVVAGVLMILVARPLNKLMHGVK